jgi:hypothetical protein
MAASPKSVVGAEWSGQCESEGAAWHPQSAMGTGGTSAAGPPWRGCSQNYFGALSWRWTWLEHKEVTTAINT